MSKEGPAFGCPPWSFLAGPHGSSCGAAARGSQAASREAVSVRGGLAGAHLQPNCPLQAGAFQPLLVLRGASFYILFRLETLSPRGSDLVALCLSSSPS